MTDKKYVCAVTKIDCYVYVDPETGDVAMVVADDNSLPPLDTMAYRYADENFIVDFQSNATEDEKKGAIAVMSSTVWPAWEWTW